MTSARRQQAAELGMLIARSRRVLYLSATRALDARGESMLVWLALNRLRHEGALTQVELALQTGHHPAGISRLLEALERRGAVRRERDPDDRRKVRVGLTAQGRSWLGRVDPVVHAAAEEALAPLGAGERRRLKDILAKLVGLAGASARARG